ncbi:MAG TPA: histidinol-phosphate transaminase [Phycisphaerae bacterium]|nr:histidinol-phosphate transaminase [Phycisphaerae bacterium]HUT60640.1 histidinol-phosphate transaminase [Phycisphaerae bacterium]
MSYFRKNIEAMPPYVPGEQPAAGDKVVKLNTNENPYPPSPKAMRVLRELDGERLRLYSDPVSSAFCRAAADALGVPADWVLAGNGSDDLLAMIITACAGPGRRVVYPAPTYVLYRTLAEMQEADIVEVPFDADYNLPLDELIAADAAVTFIARPNSPSGTVCPLDLVAELAAAVSGLVVLDEAYVDFADDDGLDLVRRHENLIALRSLSKGYSLAGLRLGFGVASPDLLAVLGKVKDSYPVDTVACLVGAAAMADQAHMKANAEKVKASRAKLAEELGRLGLKVWPSQSNFLLAAVRTGSAEPIYEGLKQRGILVRYFREPALADKLRITVGTDEQNGALVRALGEMIT